MSLDGELASEGWDTWSQISSALECSRRLRGGCRETEQAEGLRKVRLAELVAFQKGREECAGSCGRRGCLQRVQGETMHGKRKMKNEKPLRGGRSPMRK